MDTLPPAPADFDDYWAAVDAELAALPGAATLDPLPLRSNDANTVYALHLTSLGPYRIFGFYSEPTGPDPFPALYYTPRYGSVNNPAHIDDRERYAVLVLMHRGQRLADQPYAAAYPGLLTDGIADPASYVYRGIVADCRRGLEFLTSRPNVDSTRIAVVGDDLALLTAARQPNVSVVEHTGNHFYRLREARHRTDGYPIEELNDFLRGAPADAAAVDATLAYFDPLYHAPRVKAPVLATLAASGLGDAAWQAPLAAALAGPVTPYTLTNKGGIDHDEREAWLAAQMGVPARPRLWTTFV